MIKALFVFFLIALTFAPTKNTDPLNYMEYQKGFNKVEELIADEKFNLAGAKLDSLFEEYDIKFAKDLVVAAQLSALNNENEKSVKWLITATRKGVKIQCLKSIPILNKRLSAENWKKIEGQVSEARKEYLSHIDFALAREFHNRFQQEQETKGKEYYQNTVYSNFLRIKGLIQAGNFPGEQMIGIDDEQYAKSIEDCGLGNSRIIVTLLHYDYPLSEISEEVFIQALERGELHPREFATIYNFEKNKVSVLYQKSRRTYPELPQYNFNFPFGEKCNDLEKVNSDRSKFGICPYEVDLKIDNVCRKYGLKLRFNYR